MPRAISRTLLALAGVLLCVAAGWRYLEMRRFQAAENRRLELALRAHTPASQTPGDAPAVPLPAPPRKPAGSLVGRIQIPRLKLSAIVLEGSDDKTLRLGVGRVPETAEPGSAGNVVLAAHRDTLFRPLRGIRNGDEISLITPQGIYRYTVDWTEIVDPENIEPLKSTPQPSLTLVTCYPFHYIGPAPQRFIVRARQESSPETEASAPAPAPAAVPRPAAAASFSTTSTTMKPTAPQRARVITVISRNPKRHAVAGKLKLVKRVRKVRRIARQKQPQSAPRNSFLNRLTDKNHTHLISHNANSLAH